MPKPSTTTTCTDCGNEIPESLLADALCVACRYQPGKAANQFFNDEGEPALSEYDAACDKQAFATYCTTVDTQQEKESYESVRADAQTIIGEFIRTMIQDATPLQTGQRIHVLGFLAGLHTAKTQRELATALNVSPGRITQIRAAFPMVLQGLTRLNSR